MNDEEWVFAKTYAETWPHEYLVRERVDAELFLRLVEHIRANGYLGKFYSKEITYYDEGGLVYWTMGAPVEETTIINRCRKEQTYEYRLAHDDLPGIRAHLQGHSLDGNVPAMKRRTFFRRLFGSLGAAATGAPLGAGGRTVLIQECQIAGFQFHNGDAIWSSLAVGAPLSLVRESANNHDRDAVAIYFEDQMLGYVPRGENTAIAQMLDRGEELEASITRLRDDEDPWERIRMSVSVV